MALFRLHFCLGEGAMEVNENQVKPFNRITQTFARLYKTVPDRNDSDGDSATSEISQSECATIGSIPI